MRYYVELDRTNKTTAFDLLTDPTGVAAKYWYAGQADYDYDISAFVTPPAIAPPGGAPKDTLDFAGVSTVDLPTVLTKPTFSAKYANGM